MRNWIIAFSMLVLAACAAQLSTDEFLSVRATTVKVADDFGHGSGTVIDANTVLTAAHVVRDGETLNVEFPDGRLAAATVTWRDDTSDAALMQLAVPEELYSRIDCTPLKLGERVFTFGNPGFLRFVLTEGVVAGTESLGDQKNRMPEGMPAEIEPMLVVSANWEPGDSGSAVFDSKGRVRGPVSIVFRVEGSNTNNSLITPVSVLPACKGA